MQHAPILTVKGKEAGKIELAPSLFGAPVNDALIHQAVVRQLAGKRLGTTDTLHAGEPVGVEPFCLDHRERHVAVQLRVVRQVDLLAPALAQEAFHDVAAAGKRGGEGGRRLRIIR